MEARELFEGNLDPSIRQQLFNKWEKLVGDIPNKRVAQNTAMLLENEMNHLKNVLTEATSTANVAEYTKFIFPLIRSVWPALLANNICSVQPMDGPVGAIGTYLPKYATTKGTITAGDSFPNVDNFDVNYSKAYTDASESLGTYDSTSKTFYKVLAHGRITPGSFSVTTGAVTGTDDGNGNITGTGITAGVINYEGGNVTVVFTSAPTAAITATYSYLTENSSSGIGEISSDISIIPVRAGSRKLVSLYSVEVAEDMKALWGADAEADLIGSAASQIALEVDRELIGLALNNVLSGHSTTWSAAYDATNSQIAQVDHIRTLIHKLSTMSQKVYKATLRQPANWIVTSPEVIALLDQLPEFTPAATQADQTYSLGVQKAGVLSGKWQVWADPFMAAGTILLGYKGNSFAEAGLVYAPYIPIQLTPTFFNPTSFQMSKGVRTRYAAKLVNANFFAKVTVTGL